MSEQHLLNFCGHLRGKKRWTNENPNHQRALTKLVFWAFNWKWIRNSHVKFPIKYTQGLKSFKKECFGQRKVWVIPSPHWWEEMINFNELQTQSSCWIAVCPQNLLEATHGKAKEMGMPPPFARPGEYIWRLVNSHKESLRNSEQQIHVAAPRKSCTCQFPEMTLLESQLSFI